MSTTMQLPSTHQKEFLSTKEQQTPVEYFQSLTYDQNPKVVCKNKQAKRTTTVKKKNKKLQTALKNKNQKTKEKKDLSVQKDTSISKNCQMSTNHKVNVQKKPQKDQSLTRSVSIINSDSHFYGKLTLTNDFLIFSPDLKIVQNHLKKMIQQKYTLFFQIISIIKCQICSLPSQMRIESQKRKKNLKILQLSIKEHGSFRFIGNKQTKEMSKTIQKKEKKKTMEKHNDQTNTTKGTKRKNEITKQKTKQKQIEERQKKKKGKVEEQKSITSPIKKFFSKKKSKDSIKIDNSRLVEKIDLSKELDDDFIPSIVNGISKILTNENIETIFQELPKSLSLSDWKLIFNTENDGISFNTFYQSMDPISSSLMIIQTTDNDVFGIFNPTRIHLSNSFYGTSRGFMFTFYPEFKTFRSSGKNDFYILTTNKSLSFGGGTNYGIWISKDFINGSSQYCETYQNDELAQKRDFALAKVEIFSFVG
ncbi:nucleolar protein 7/estrogen receptor coactivator-related [Anaeramoeba flamelloides]|uniref:Nucleolar protein 7/estrogen receptor coactivator-related n=1 Tax=Anaeramoeba flamelloides TaxID=1746091 RepID=A0ABQ8X5X8_9EUKA|nr:nucleolar protein 7/estrogen receptor coactivator-related [Anaeramoeba flamelloides]